VAVNAVAPVAQERSALLQVQSAMIGVALPGLKKPSFHLPSCLPRPYSIKYLLSVAAKKKARLSRRAIVVASLKVDEDR